MRLTETIPTNAGPVTVRELTVGEVRTWLAGLEAKLAQQVDVVDDALFDDFSLADLPLFAPMEDGSANIDAMTQSDVHKIHDAAKRINPDFFALRGKLLMAGRVIPVEKPEAPAES